MTELQQDNSGNEDIKKSWYVVQVKTGSEKPISEKLKKLIEIKGMDHHFGEISVPTEEVVEVRSGSKRRSESKFFPGYVLVETHLSDEVWHFINNVPGVIGFIGGARGNPAPLSEKEANSIMNRMEEGVDKPRPSVSYVEGESVRVIEGPFADFDAVVEEVNYEKNRVRVSVMIFDRATPLELDFGQVEKN